MGLPLNVSASDEVPLTPVSGFATPDPTLLGVLISHPHVDHYGLAYRLPQRTMFLIGKAAQSILAAADIFTPAGIIFQNVMFLEDQKPSPWARSLLRHFSSTILLTMRTRSWSRQMASEFSILVTSERMVGSGSYWRDLSNTLRNASMFC